MTEKHPLRVFAETLRDCRIGQVIPGTTIIVDTLTLGVFRSLGDRLVCGMADGERAAVCAAAATLDPVVSDAIRRDRGAAYGSFASTLAEFGVSAGSILRQAFPEFNGQDGNPRLPDIPPHVAGWLIVALKSHRAVSPHRYDVDDYNDAFNYMREASRNDPMRDELLMGAQRGTADAQAQEGGAE